MPEVKRVLIIAKTYPELSSKYVETVCTAAVDEQGKPYRLYPIPYRYLSGPLQFGRYQWIEAPLTKSADDSRPESFRIDVDRLQVGEVVPTTYDEWGRRREFVFKSPDWIFSSMLSLQSAQKLNGTSLAFIYPAEVRTVRIRRRDKLDQDSFKQKLDRFKAENSAERDQLTLFDSLTPAEMKELQYIGERVSVEWICSDLDCAGHEMQILDWEICELARREGSEAAKAKVEELLCATYRTGFMLGNFNAYRHNFAIIGLWYPKRSEMLF